MELANGKTNQLIWKNTRNRYHVENHDIELENPNVSFSILAQRVEDNATVLDIACGEGRWGDVLKKKQCVIYGVDIDEAAVDYLRKRGTYEHVWKADIENINNDSELYRDLLKLRKDITCIGLLDILEHTINPTKVIQNIVSLIDEEKKILISVPNIGHADVFLNLINGNFNYQEMGILDNTHTKYFTKRSFLQWIKEINESAFGFKLDCSYLGGTFSSTQYLDNIAKEYPDLYTIVQQNKEYNVVQLLFELTKKNEDALTPQLDNEIKNDSQLDMLQLFENNILDKEGLISILRNNSLSWNERKFFENRLNLLSEEDAILNNQKMMIEKQLQFAQEQWEINRRGWKENEKQLRNVTSLLEEKSQYLYTVEKELEHNMRGWKESDNQLQTISKTLQVKEEQLNKAVNEWNRNVHGWEESDRQLQDILELLSKKEEQLNKAVNEWERNAYGWQESDKQLQDTLELLGKKEEQLSKAVNEWERNAYGWQESDQQLQSSLNLIKAKEELLTKATIEWERNTAGWRKCDEQVRIITKQLEEKELELISEKKHTTSLEEELSKERCEKNKILNELREIKGSKWWSFFSKLLSKGYTK